MNNLMKKRLSSLNMLILYKNQKLLSKLLDTTENKQGITKDAHEEIK